MKLNKQAAERAIRTKIAEPLGLSVIEAAALIVRLVDEKMASAIRKEVVLRGYRPEEFAIFAMGGGGATHAAGYRDEIPRVVIFPYSPVFCAYGSSIMDVMHVYEVSKKMPLIAPVTQQPILNYEVFNQTVQTLMEQAKREMEAEGLPVAKTVLTLELDMLYGGQIHSKRTSTPSLFIHGEDDLWQFYNQFEQEFSEAFSPLVVNLPGGVYIETFVLKAAIPAHVVDMPEQDPATTAIGTLQKGSRLVFWPKINESVDTPLFEQSELKPGHEVVGPAIIESEYTTIVVPPGLHYRVDRYSLGILEKD